MSREQRAVAMRRQRMAEAGVGKLPVCEATGKKCYPDYASAENDRTKMLRRVAGAGDGLVAQIYHCNRCGSIHIGSGPRRWGHP